MKDWYQSTIIVIGLIISLLSLAYGIDKATQQQIMDAAAAILNAGAAIYMVYRRWTTPNPLINRK